MKTSRAIQVKYFLIAITMLYCIIFPADKLNIKELLLFSSMMSCMNEIIDFLKHANVKYVYFAFLYPIITIILSVTVGDSSMYDAASYGYVWLFLLLLPAVNKYEFNISKIFICGTLVVSTVINLIYLLDMFQIVSIYKNPLIIFFSNMNEMQWGKGVLATFGYSIFHKASPLLIVSLGYCLHNRKLVLSICFFLSLMACGTRANFIAAVFVLVLILLFEEKTGTERFFVLSFIALAAIFILPVLVNKIIALNELKADRSESIKFEDAKTIFNLIKQNPQYYLFGTGIGSYFHSNARAKQVNICEFSYLDYFRQVGVFGFISYLYFILIPFKYWRDYFWLVVSLIAYLAAAFTNPFSVNSTAFMVYLLVYSYFYKSAKNREIKNLFSCSNFKISLGVGYEKSNK